MLHVGRSRSTTECVPSQPLSESRSMLIALPGIAAKLQLDFPLFCRYLYTIPYRSTRSTHEDAHAVHSSPRSQQLWNLLYEYSELRDSARVPLTITERTSTTHTAGEI